MDQQSPPRIFFFGAGRADGGGEVRHLVGGKGASLGDLTRAGFAVPPGFTISTDCCRWFHSHGRNWPAGLEDEVRQAVRRLEEATGRTFGEGPEPLLLAVRSGAAVSMPGMMDTVLNVGLHPALVGNLSERLGPGIAWQAFRSYLRMYLRTVMRLSEEEVERLLAEMPDRPEGDPAAAGLVFLEALPAAQRVPTDPWEQLRAAIEAVFDSWNNERAVHYRRHHRIEGLEGTAVTVQTMCPARAAGVLFTANPLDPAAPDMLLESSFGLGEAVVLGMVTPDRFVLDRNGPTLRERHLADKKVVVGSLAAADGRGDEASLSDTQVVELAALGLRVEQLFGAPCDIEWGLTDEGFQLLQARPVRFAQRATDDEAADLEAVRQEEIAALRALADPGGTVWSRFNLSEILPTPTPLTWSIVRRFMSGQGGFGLMYRDLGFDPDPALNEIGIFDLVCGRPYCNLSREPRMQYRSLPFEHAFAFLKAHPERALYPQARPNFSRARWTFWLTLPWTFLKMFRGQLRLRRLARTFGPHFRDRTIPAFLQEVHEAEKKGFSGESVPSLIAGLEHWMRRTLVDFAREGLKATALAGIAMGNLERVLGQRLQPPPGPGRNPVEAMAVGLQRAQAFLRELVMGVRAEPGCDLPTALQALAEGKIAPADFLRDFGHRGSGEMELSQPRWSEEPEAIGRMAEETRGGGIEGHAPRNEPEEIWDRLSREAFLLPSQRAVVESEVDKLRGFLALRETAKHHLMRGYAQIRRHVVELSQRWSLGDDIFFLTLEEVVSLTDRGTLEESTTTELKRTIEARKKRRRLALSLSVPPVIFSDDLEAIGRAPVAAADGERVQGVPLSAGTAEGPAWVLDELHPGNPPGQGYILVCPSTDPSWVPLFAHAGALVMETGGVLSHGAIVAREYGLPAVAGIPDAVRRFRTGQRLRVDGGKGTVQPLPGPGDIAEPG